MEQKQLESIAREYGVVLLVQFGSTVSGREHARSDVDLGALLTDPAPSLRIDLALINRADPLFLKKITEHCRLIYGTSRRLHELKMYAFRRYQDHRRYLALERAYVDRALRALIPP